MAISFPSLETPITVPTLRGSIIFDVQKEGVTGKLRPFRDRLLLLIKDRKQILKFSNIEAKGERYDLL